MLAFYIKLSSLFKMYLYRSFSFFFLLKNYLTISNMDLLVISILTPHFLLSSYPLPFFYPISPILLLWTFFWPTEFNYDYLNVLERGFSWLEHKHLVIRDDTTKSLFPSIHKSGWGASTLEEKSYSLSFQLSIKLKNFVKFFLIEIPPKDLPG